MKNRTGTVLVLGLAAFLAPASFLRAEEPPAKTTQGSLELSGYGTSVDGTPDKAMEYEPTGRYLPWKLLVSSHEHWGSVLVSSEGNGTNDQKHFLSLDVQRAVRDLQGIEVGVPCQGLAGAVEPAPERAVVMADVQGFRQPDLRAGVLEVVDDEVDQQLQLPGVGELRHPQHPHPGHFQGRR